VNAIAPGIVASRGTDEGQWATEEARQAGVGGTPLGRVGLPDEIAACAVWLAGPAGEFATGATFVIDGGQAWKGMDGPHRLRTWMREQQEQQTDTNRDATRKEEH
jgi:NAD(P)-dependent dehydrogenase (short-subunit alcohol dehydrogenase family)